MGLGAARRPKVCTYVHPLTATGINRGDRPVSNCVVKLSDAATSGRLYRGASTSDADGSVLITPESGWRSQNLPEVAEICYDGHLPATVRADIQRTPAVLAIAVHAV